jgi:RNA polymerase sigma-70 factor (sigma-E family)
VGLRALDPGFDAFVSAASPRLLRLGYRLTGDRHAAEDLLQLALWQVAKHWPRARDNPVAYANRTLVNLATDGWRRRARRPEELGVGSPPEHGAPSGTDQIDDRHILIDALRRLPPRQRAVVVLRFWEDLSVDDTAALLGCSTGNVKSTSSRALERLRAVLEPEGAHR